MPAAALVLLSGTNSAKRAAEYSISRLQKTAHRISQQINLAPQGAAGATVARVAPSVLPPAAAEPDVETGTPGTPEAATGPVAGAVMLPGPISSVLKGVSPLAGGGAARGGAEPRGTPGASVVPPRSASGGTEIEKLGLYSS